MAVQMISDVDIWRAAMTIVRRYGDDAMLEAAARARELMADRDMDGCTTWLRIGDAAGAGSAKEDHRHRKEEWCCQKSSDGDDH